MTSGPGRVIARAGGADVTRSPIRLKLWHGMIVVAALGIALAVSNLGGRWQAYRVRAIQFWYRAEADRARVDFLLYQVPKLRDRPEIEGKQAYLAYRREWLDENSAGKLPDFPVSYKEWTNSFQRDNSEKRSVADEFLREAAEFDRRKFEYETRWW